MRDMPAQASVGETDEGLAFERLVEPELAGAYQLAGYLLRDAGEAQDALQDALAKAWRAWRGLRQADRFGIWFDRIVANECRDRLRRARRAVRMLELDDTVAEVASPRDPFREALARDEMGRLVRLLEPDQQIVVALRFWRDLPLEEIAEVLVVPLGTVKSRLHYAIRRLREELERQGEVVR